MYIYVYVKAELLKMSEDAKVSEKHPRALLNIEKLISKW